MRRAWPVALLLLVLTGTAEAADRCSFAVAGSTWTLNADCATEASIVIPDGFILDGSHHTIVAVDPLDGSFHGGIVTNGGASATVINTVISAIELADVCQTGHDRLRAIYLNGASGLVRGNTILNVNKGASSCQEGNGIEVRNANLGGPAATVDISGNIVEGFQKTGIVVSGHVDAVIRGNSIGASAAQRRMAANGIQAGSGARVEIEGNTIAGNSWDGDAAATAILLVSTAPGTVVRGNTIFGNADVGIYVMADGVRIERNRLTDTGPDGSYDVGIGSYGEGNVIEGNSISGYRTRYQGVPDVATGGTTVAGR